jgi:2-(1,2-epoxy-1,2-dihydrophenyl)acetyl-CoA isomerase
VTSFVQEHTTDVVRYEVDGGVATVTLDRPDRLNTMNQHLLESVLAILEAAADDDSVRVVILTGAGRAFCAGGDLQAMAAGEAGGLAGGASTAGRIDTLRHAMRTSQLLREMPKATIAQINGACAGAGLAWASACDLRYCAESAVFNTAFITAGLSGDFGGTWTVPRIVGQAKAAELYLLAEKFGAAEAERIGLVTRSVPDGDLAGEVRKVASRLAGFAPLALAAVKANLNDSANSSFAAHLDREAERHIRCGLTEDAQEAAAAFLEKRAPVFHGR